MGRDVTGIAVGSDARQLYASVRGGVVVFDTAAGTRSGAFDIPAGERVIEAIPSR
jgi:hypothetical protein